MAEIPNLLISRVEREGAPTLLLFAHKAKSVDFKLTPCKQLEDGSWEYCETYNDPETTGYFKTPSDDKLEMYASQPKKWCQKFTKNADGVWECKDPQSTAVASDIAPAPSKVGAGGLPKGQVNLGEQNDDFNALWPRAHGSELAQSRALFLPH